MRRAIFLTIIVVSLFIIKNLVTSIYNLWQKQDLITQAQKEFEEAKKKNQELKTKLEIANSERFIEEQARNRLFLVKPNEQQIVIPPHLLKPSVTPKPTESPKPNWQQWWDLFFKV